MPKQPNESDFDWGDRVGFSDEIILHVEHHFSAEFCRGYYRGRNEIEALIEDAMISRINYA